MNTVESISQFAHDTLRPSELIDDDPFLYDANTNASILTLQEPTSTVR